MNESMTTSDLLRVDSQAAEVPSAESAKLLLAQEIENIIPLVASKEDIEGYQLAKAMCSPEVIRAEADPLRFLEFCKFNPWDAAKRIIEYWKLRLDTFGPDRFWRRILDTSGNQALSPEASRIVQETEAVFLLPPDQFGRTVLFQSMEKAKLKIYSKMSSEDRKSIMFYALQLVTSQQASTQNGFTYIQVRLESDYKFFPDCQKLVSDGTKSCFPVTFKGFHMICAPKQKETIQRRFANKLLPFIWKLMESVVPHAERRTLDFVQWTNASDRREKLRELLMNKFRLTREGLPVVAGGPWNFKRFQESDLAPPATLPEGETTLPFNALDFYDLDLEFLISNDAPEEAENSKASTTFVDPSGMIGRRVFSQSDYAAGPDKSEGQGERRAKKTRF
jgi:hypothetical protein